ncbi:MAG: DNA polymerase III subunit delta [Actinomycetaceae bacterium]|nr:DNA polymerase III subunit delta [Actinomycetaceae bacterium]
MAATRKKPKANEHPWFEAALAPVVLIKSGEALLGDRAVSLLKRAARAVDASVDMQTVDAARYESGQLAMFTSPSLFGEARFVYIPELEHPSKPLAEDLIAYLRHPAPDVTVALRHNGGNGGRAVLNALQKAKVPTYIAAPLKNARDKLEFVRGEVRNAGRQIEAPAAQALVDALGADIAELASATNQLLTDVDGRITVDHVHRYQAGRMDVTGFAVADAAIAGNMGRALTLLRHALASGVEPVALVASLAMKLRQLAKVTVQPRPSPSELRMAPWQIDRAVRESRGWSEEALAYVIDACATCDAEVKGQSRDSHYAVEKLVIAVTRARYGRF